MSTILDPIVKRLRAMTPAEREAVAEATGCKSSFIRKLAARDRENPRLENIQPLISYFAKADAKARRKPVQEA